ncbi:MAG: MerR family transcriptional regulator [Spirochaetales bacterium]|jgi:DNA-binding transcriptional MerR regulator|nr:MerR family transcriptional regulator [Spirochaetales bacterium]
MDGYSKGEVCRLLQIKPHVLRYWEQEIPLLAPRRDGAGRRVYAEQDLHILYRIRSLSREEKLTLDGVRQRLLSEAAGENPGLAGRIRLIRGKLLGCYRILGIQKRTLGILGWGENLSDNEYDDLE